MLDMSVRLDDLAIKRKLRQIQKKTGNLQGFFRQLSEVLITEYKRNMSSGKDADGRPLQKIDGWTRFAAIGRGKKQTRRAMVPLQNTGQMRAGLGLIRATNNQLIIGFQGAQEKKVIANLSGRPSEMRLRSGGVKGEYSGIRTGQNSQKYIRYRTQNGWRSRRVNGNSITVTPRKRKFFYLSRKQNRMIIDEASDYIKRALK